MQSITWSPMMALGEPVMDETHNALLDEMQRLSAAPDEQFAAGFLALVAVLERDFRREEELMEDIDFPALASHREQHARVLSGLHHAVPSVMRGDDTPARDALRLLPQWFLFHLVTMDQALAVALDLARMQESLSQVEMP